MEPAALHLALINKLQQVADGRIRRLMVFMPPRSAKALALDTPVPTPGGWANIGDLRAGDSVFDERGEICRVTGVSPVWRDRLVFDVATDCGDRIVADEQHQWRVQLCRKERRGFKLKETWQLARARTKRPLIERASALRLPEAILPIDPWVLGYWLGDGHSAAPVLTIGDQDREWVLSELDRIGQPWRLYPSEITQCLLPQMRGKLMRLGVATDTSAAGLRRSAEPDLFARIPSGKHIPVRYLRASIDQRLALLQGLIDSDGHVTAEGRVEFSNTNHRLATEVQELVRSLGVKASMTEGRASLYGRDCGPTYRVSFYKADAARMPRKRDRCRDGTKTPNTYIEVTQTGRRDTVCISVDSPSRLFLCGRSMTPTHNSTYATELFPPWWMANHPEQSIITASYNADLARRRFGRRVRNLVMQYPHTLGYHLSPDSTAAGLWATTQGGEYVATGIGGSVVGRPGNLILIDDPVGSAADAKSETNREAVWEWYKSDLYTRREADAAIILIMTRWHADDLAGRLLAEEEETGDKWDVINFPAIAEANDMLGRAPGEALWPERYPLSWLEATRAVLDDYRWQALYQQHPRPVGGAFFAPDAMPYIDAVHPHCQRIRAWDFGYTERGDWSAGLRLALLEDGRCCIEDVVRFRAAPDRTEQLVLATAIADGIATMISIPDDPGAGRWQVQNYMRQPLLRQHIIIPTRPDQQKEVRARAVAAQVNIGNVCLLRDAQGGMGWNRALKAELADFPLGKYDDQADALSDAYNNLVANPPPFSAYITDADIAAAAGARM